VGNYKCETLYGSRPEYGWLFLEFRILVVVLCAKTAALVSWTVWSAIQYASLPPIFDDPEDQRDFEKAQRELEARRRRGD
jgi:hypothetical protein